MHSYWLSNAKELEQKQSLPRLKLRFVILLSPIKEEQRLFTALSLDNQLFLAALILSTNSYWDFERAKFHNNCLPRHKTVYVRVSFSFTFLHVSSAFFSSIMNTNA